jgi:hypothetical protein
MYKCDRCGKITGAGEYCSKIVTGKRDVVYINTILEEEKVRKIIPMRVDPLTLTHNQKVIAIKETKGWEIVSEEKVCSTCKETNEKT